MSAAVWGVFLQWRGNPVDALCYWLTDPSHPYGRVDYQFVYSPVVAQIIAPLLRLPFDTFVAVIRAAEIIGLVLLAGPLAAPVILLDPVAAELNAANINLVLALVIVLAFRWPALWALALLTKPSMGVGLLWFAARREWRSLAIALGTTGAFALVSMLVAPSLWFDWINLLMNGTPQVGLWPFPYPIWVRLPIAALLVVWGARTNRRWTVVAAATIALPRLYFQSPALLLGMLPLLGGIGPNVAWVTRRLGRLNVQALAPAPGLNHPTAAAGTMLRP